MRLYAISDLHISHKLNEQEFRKLKPHPNDGLIICGDVGEKVEHLKTCFEIAKKSFKQVFWVPGNHELYTLANDKTGLRGEAKYKACVKTATDAGVITPEDPYQRWEGEGETCIIAPTFVLYDYSFRPEHVPMDQALDWAMEEGLRATDEVLLHPDPYESREAWCAALVEKTEAKLEEASAEGIPLLIINHWPLRQDLVTIPAIPRFSIWCGTKKTEDWHNRYNACICVTGHLHVRRTDHIDGCRFEEVSLGYPRQWEDARKKGKDINDMLREILPGPPYNGTESTIWRRYG